MSDRDRIPGDDPRLRPPDPAGTQPKFDPADLLPSERERLLRPQPAVEGDAVEEHDGDLLPERLDEAPVTAVGPAAARGESRYAPRFQFILGALLAVGAAAVVLAVAMVAGKDEGGRPSTATVTGPKWSDWQPVPGGIDAPTQIAQHVSREYRLPSGKQLVAVTGGPLAIADLPLTVALRESAAQGGDIELVEGNGVLFQMCGLGPKCTIAEGEPSEKRALLLHRQALELALYSFRYLPGIDEAVVFLPPHKLTPKEQAAAKTDAKDTGNLALFFRRGDADIQRPVSQPLDATLTARTPSVAGVKRSPDAPLVSSLTSNKLFRASLTTAEQTARAFLVLDPLSGG